MTARGPTVEEPLAGVVILELGGFITAPYAGLLLADLGADVIKIERPEGDPFRAFRGGSYSPNFVGFNRNKRSVVLDLGKPAGRDAFVALAARADVVLENFRPGVMERLGLAWDTLRARNPRLVYCAIRGFPPSRGHADDPAFDVIGQAESGMLHAFLDPERPEVRGPTIADQLAGMQACQGILGALYARATTDKGCRVDVNMVESAMAFMPDFFASYTRDGTLMQSTTRAAYSHSFAFRCSDEAFLGVQLSSPEKFWRALVTAIGRPELAVDPRFSTRSLRIENFAALTGVLQASFVTQPMTHWHALLSRADVPCAPVRTVADVVGDASLHRGGSFHGITHPQMGDVTCVSRPVLYDGLRPLTRHAPPVLGEHTGAVLREFAVPAPAPTATSRGDDAPRPTPRHPTPDGNE